MMGNGGVVRGMAEDDWVTRPKVERVELEGSLRRIRSSAGNGGVAIPMFSHYEDQLRVGDGITAEVGVVAAEAELGGRGKAARRGEGAVEKKQENAAGRGFLAARQRKKTKKRGGGLGEIFLMDTEPKARRAWHEEGDNSDFLGDRSDGAVLDPTVGRAAATELRSHGPSTHNDDDDNKDSDGGFEQ
ncbi:Os09g0331500 [Oryza sativa Japonica Group]|uniref:Os09g0331500 protein n=1 Tax=Oryza sativa subsp. japonica TaxID=39947 RepID=A0A0P0XLG3_ORYSJ|nr:Os09g0331500 [Oryza sativa Japonica Group]